jgi:hypothetical protein
MHLKPEDQERVAQAYLKDAGNKQLSAERRMKARGEAQRWKALAQGVVSSLAAASLIHAALSSCCELFASPMVNLNSH